MSNIPEKLIRFTNINETLLFLQESYEKFNSYDAAKQNQILEHNAQVRNFTDPKSLLYLYITLAMHDEMIQKFPKDVSELLLNTTLRNKFRIQQLIKQKEESKEIIVPEEKIAQGVKDCEQDEEKLQVLLLNWVPQEEKEHFASRLKVLFERTNRANRKNDKRDYLFKFLVKEFAKLKMAKHDNGITNNVETNREDSFHDLVCMIECIMLFFHGL